MARARDEKKRECILLTAKVLFSRKGFVGTSISDIVAETGYPVGTIYTYFKNKEHIIQTIVEEGWVLLSDRLMLLLNSGQGVAQKLSVLLNQFLPELFLDVDLITILLSEAVSLTRIEEKVDQLSSMIYGLVKEFLPAYKGAAFSQQSMRTALIVYFLGILNAVKISRDGSVKLSVEEIISFVKQTIESSLGFELKGN